MVCIIHAGQNISAGCSLSGRFYVNSCLQPLVQLLPSSHMVSSRWPFTDALPSIITDAFGRFQLISAVYLKDWLRSRSWMSLSAEMLTLHITSTFRQQMVETVHIILLKEAEKPLYLRHMLHLRSWQLKWWWTLRCPSCHRRHQRPRAEVNELCKWTFQRKCGTGVSCDVDHNVPRLCVTRLFGQSRAPFVICLRRGNVCFSATNGNDTPVRCLLLLSATMGVWLRAESIQLGISQFCLPPDHQGDWVSDATSVIRWSMMTICSASGNRI